MYLVAVMHVHVFRANVLLLLEHLQLFVEKLQALELPLLDIRGLQHSLYEQRWVSGE
jgi:hypothetical protein